MFFSKLASLLENLSQRVVAATADDFKACAGLLCFKKSRF